MKKLDFLKGIGGLGTLLLALSVVLSGCASKPINQPASMAVRYGAVTNLSDVRVRVSLQNRAVYVYENEEPRFVAAIAIGTQKDPTPTGNKLPRKRSNTYGFFVQGDQVVPGKRTSMPSGYRYVGYPMPWWVEFKSGYGFHAGAVWPQPRTHGCLRLHRSVAKDFFNMVDGGTPIHIAHSLPDAPFDSTNVLF